MCEAQAAIIQTHVPWVKALVPAAGPAAPGGVGPWGTGGVSTSPLQLQLSPGKARAEVPLAGIVLQKQAVGVLGTVPGVVAPVLCVAWEALEDAGEGCTG